MRRTCTKDSRDGSIRLINQLEVQNLVCCSVFRAFRWANLIFNPAKHGIARDFIYAAALAGRAAQVAWRTKSIRYDRPLHDDVVFIQGAFTEEDTPSIIHTDWRQRPNHSQPRYPPHQLARRSSFFLSSLRGRWENQLTPRRSQCDSQERQPLHIIPKCRDHQRLSERHEDRSIQPRLQ